MPTALEELLRDPFAVPEPSLPSAIDETTPLPANAAVNELVTPTPTITPLLTGVVGTNAEGNEADQKLAIDLGVPKETVKAAPELARTRARTNAINELLDSSRPVTRRLMSDPEFAEVAHPAVEDLSALESLSRAFERGSLTRELGIAGHRFRFTRSPKQEEHIGRIKTRLQELGQDPDGVVGWLSAAAEVLGQQVSSFASTEAAVRVGSGGATGAAIGAFGGPVAPATAAIGATLGLGAGLVAHFAVDSFEVEGGLAYLEMLEKGIESDTASWISLGVGTINAGLEMAGATAVLKPVSEGVKAAFRTKLREAVNKPALQAAAKRLAIAYGGGVTAEVATEVAQESVNIIGEEIGKALSEGDFEDLTSEEVQDRLGDIALQTFKAMTVLAAPGPVTNFAVDANAARKAKNAREALQATNEAAKASKLAQVSPEKAAVHLEESLKEVGVDDVFISVEAIDQAAIAQQLDPNVLHTTLGTTSQVEQARLLGGDVRVSSRGFAEHILQTDLHEQLADHIRMEDDSMTAAEAQEFEANGLREQTERMVPDDAITFETAEDLVEGDANDQQFRAEALSTIIGRTEHQIGLEGLFRTAREAGLTNKEYNQYLVARQRAADAAGVREERKRLKLEKKQNTAAQKAQRELVEDEIRENVNQRAVYGALNAIGVDRLDRKMVTELLPNGEAQLAELPKQAGRQIFTPKKVAGMDPDVLAELYGFPDGQTMLFSMIDAQPVEVIVQQETDQRLQDSEVREEGTRIDQALEALHNDNYAEVLAFELNQLRETKKAGRLKASLVKQIAKERIGELILRDIKPNKFVSAERREAGNARRALRAGDRELAAQAKFQQLLNFQFAQLAYKAQEKIKNQNKFLKQFAKKRKKFKTLPVSYLQAIKTILSDFDLGPKLSDARRTKLLEWAENQAVETGQAIQIPRRIADTDGKTNFQDLALREWEELHDTVKSIQAAGLKENKFLRAEEAQTRQEVVDVLGSQIANNLKSRAGQIVETRWEHAKAHGREAALSALNTESLVRQIDGFEDLGAAHDAITRPYNRAMTEGYHPGQVGYTKRTQNESKKLVELYEVYDKAERLAMKKRIEIPGVRSRMSHQRVLSVLLNSGNADNRKALIESDQFSEEEIAIIHDFASEKDWNFVQSIWTYLDGFWPEIKEAIERRRNVIAEKAEALPVETKFGTFTGGYFPLQYDSTESVLTVGKDSSDVVKEARFGHFTASHTKNGHTKERVGSGGRPVKLDLFTLNAHVDQVVYDLEVGDAVTDIYKVIHHKDLKKAFEVTGHLQMWEKLDLWLGDIATGEMHYSGVMQKTFRHLRTGFVISKIGFNLGTVMLQPFGLLQSSVQIGKYNTWRGLVTTLTAPQFGEGNIWDFVSSQTGFMEQRQANFNREIVEAEQLLKGTLVQRFTPGKSAQIISSAAFYGIIKAQRFVDVVTWLGAKQKGMEKFKGDENKANEFADSMVERSQATGIFGGRTQFERGTLDRRTKQSEVVRGFVPLISYFMAKTNVAWERSKRTNFRNPGEVMGWATDMAILYTVEAILVAMLRNQIPDDDDESLVTFAMGETIKALVAGVPFIRDVVGEVEGFRGGGIISSVLGEFSKVATQANQGEIDTALTKSSARLAGTLLRIPGANQAVKTGEALSMALDGDDVSAWEFIIGPYWDE